MESLSGKPNCSKINDLFKVDENEHNEISKNVVNSEQEDDMPIYWKKNLSENIGKESIKSWKDMEKLEPGMTKNHEGICEEPDYNKNIKEEVCETDDILLKVHRTEETSKDNDIYEQFLSKYKDIADNFCVKKEITEELIVKNESCIFENDERVNVQGEQSYNNDVQLLIEDKYIPGCPFTTKNDSCVTNIQSKRTSNLSILYSYLSSMSEIVSPATLNKSNIYDNDYEPSESEYCPSDNSGSSDSSDSSSIDDDPGSHKRTFVRKIVVHSEKNIPNKKIKAISPEKEIPVTSTSNQISDIELLISTPKSKAHTSSPAIKMTTNSTGLCNNEISKIENKASEVKIKAVFKKSDGGRVRDKGHACYFCQKIVKSSARHLEVIHGKELEVAKILALPKNSKKRRDSFISLIRAGDFYYNTEVMATKNGELILARRPTENESKFVKYNDYGPCPYCLGFMLKKHLWHHIKVYCNNTKSESNSLKHVIAESDAILHSVYGAQFSTDFIKNISSQIREDEIGRCCKEDNLIMKFGAMQFEKYGTTQCELIRQSMRQLGRLTLKLRQMENSSNGLSDYLVPQKFDKIIEATKLLCSSHQNNVKRPKFEIPALAIKLGYALRKCAAMNRGICLRVGNISGNETVMGFLSLMDLEWNIRISSNASATTYSRKINTTELLSITSDLIKLSRYINCEMKKLQEILHNDVNLETWTQLAILCLSKIILFNKRRSGIASLMTKSDYYSKPSCSELKMSLTDFEKKLASQLDIVQIVGKQGRIIPILLTSDTKSAIDKLLETRKTLNINCDNPYVFARGGMTLSNIRGHDCLKQVCTDAGLNQPENMTSIKLGKYISTVCQVFNLSENENDWLARHLMGHDIRIHKEFHRLHESAVELTKVSRLLIAVDEGQVNSLEEKNLEDLNFEDDEDDHETISQKVANDEVHEEPTEEPIFPEIRNSSLSKKTSNTKLRKFRRKPWSGNEKEVVLNYFKRNIKRGSLPGKEDCLACLQQHTDILSSRTWTDIKFAIKNHLQRINKNKK